MIQKNDHLELLRDSSKIFPEVEDVYSIRTARIWHCRYRSLADVGKLQNLEELVIATFSDSVEIFVDLRKLRYLRILHMPKVTNLEGIRHLNNLEVLSLSTLPSWDSKRKCTVVDSLKPLSTLPKLKHLELFGVRPSDKSLNDLQECALLQTARFSQYPDAEISRFYEATSVSNSYIPAPSFPLVIRPNDS